MQASSVVVIMCIDAVFTIPFMKSIQYFTSRSGRVVAVIVRYSMSLGVMKAFVQVLHIGLHLKLIQNGVPLKFVKLLQYCCSHRVCPLV